MYLRFEFQRRRCYSQSALWIGNLPPSTKIKSRCSVAKNCLVLRTGQADTRFAQVLGRSSLITRHESLPALQPHRELALNRRHHLLNLGNLRSGQSRVHRLGIPQVDAQQ